MVRNGMSPTLDPVAGHDSRQTKRWACFGASASHGVGSVPLHSDRSVIRSFVRRARAVPVMGIRNDFGDGHRLHSGTEYRIDMIRSVTEVSRLTF